MSDQKTRYEQYQRFQAYQASQGASPSEGFQHPQTTPLDAGEDTAELRPGTGLSSKLFNFANQISPIPFSVDPQTGQDIRPVASERDEKVMNEAGVLGAEVGASFAVPQLLAGNYLNKARKAKGLSNALKATSLDSALAATGAQITSEAAQRLGAIEDTPLMEDMKRRGWEVGGGTTAGLFMKGVLSGVSKGIEKSGLTSAPATARMLTGQTGSTPITGPMAKIDWAGHTDHIYKNYPDVVDSVFKSPRLKTQFNELTRIKDETGGVIGRFYEDFGSQVRIPADDIWGHPAMKDLLGAADTSSSLRATGVGRAARRSLQQLPKPLQDSLVRSGLLPNSQGFAQFAGDSPKLKNVSLKSLWDLRQDLDDLVKFDKPNPMEKRVEKFVGDLATAMRESIDQAISSANLPEERVAEFLSAKEKYHHIMPIWQATGKNYGGKVGKIPGINAPLSFTDTLKGAGIAGLYYLNPVLLGGVAAASAAGTRAGHAAALRAQGFNPGRLGSFAVAAQQPMQEPPIEQPARNAFGAIAGQRVPVAMPRRPIKPIGVK